MKRLVEMTASFTALAVTQNLLWSLFKSYSCNTALLAYNMKKFEWEFSQDHAKFNNHSFNNENINPTMSQWWLIAPYNEKSSL